MPPLHEPLPQPFAPGDFVSTGRDDRGLRRLAERGLLVRVVRGAYVPSETWQAFSPRQRYLTLVQASLSRLDGALTASHWSAAAVWGFPVPKSWPKVVETIDERRESSSRTSRIIRRPGTIDPGDLVDWHGVRVTSPARTATDLALTYGFDDGVLVMDFALHSALGEHERLREEIKVQIEAQIEQRPHLRRARAARAAVDFADPLAESPLETISRITIARQRFPAPTLQETLADDAGTIGRPDCCWREYGLLGEVDGDLKYTDPAFMGGRSAAQVVRNEKTRQRRFENLPWVRRVVRWGAREARDPQALSSILSAAGLPRLPAREALVLPGRRTA
ncbi:type IV toxin-antitoxin system AbiEi family antitoxin domain-containing protein [Frondihabitans cladoniiphilus]|uniref:Transcriptional regulator, AbiEi antitoxin, Type IV TA system n=1 Tax=Frondihabitans cladoniiphilus TaxID=715785 RepID=A0ABP8VL94_9MICO